MKVEIRNDSVIIEGYVNAVERDSKVLPQRVATRALKNFVEKVKAKVFQRALEKRGNVEVMFNHKKVVGSIEERNLELYEDSIGLYGKATITDPEVVEKARNKELRGWSFGFIARDESWEDVNDDLQRRNLEDIDLKEVSILTNNPAYIATSIEVRDEECINFETRQNQEEVEVTDKTEERKIDYSNQEKEIEIMKIKHLQK